MHSKGMSWHQSLFYSLFQSAATRSAGLQTIDVSHFSDATNIIIGILMFIGSSPSSVGGGIRTTTFAILILFVINFSNSADKISIKVFNRNSYYGYTTIIYGIYNGFHFDLYKYDYYICSRARKTIVLQVFFEVMSAFGTCGLTLGVTDDVSNITKIVLMILMFIGRVGLISFIIMIAGRKEPKKFSYLKNVYKLDKLNQRHFKY